MGIFGPSKKERESNVALMVVAAEETWERLADEQKVLVQNKVILIFEALGGEQLQLFTIPTHHKWWFYASAMKKLEINPCSPVNEWKLGKLDPSEFDEKSESFRNAIAVAKQYVG